MLALELNLSTALKASPANDDCQTWKNKASHYMGGRQQGIALAEAVKDTNGNRSRGLLLRADNESQPSVFDAQYVAIQRFSDTIYQKCRVL